MKILIYYILIISFSSLLLRAQSYNFASEITLPRAALSFSINPQGVIYVACLNNKILKINNDGRILNEIGGYGARASSFNAPSDIAAKTLRVYVCDSENSRIQAFDKDLNYVFEINGKNKTSEFAFPQTFDVNDFGEIVLIDEQNKRIIKFSHDGGSAIEFGDYRSGRHSISNPRKLRISPDGVIYVLDEMKIISFDRFGTNGKIIRSDRNFESICFPGKIAFIATKDSIFIFDPAIDNPAFKNIEINESPDFYLNNILEINYFKEELYVLTRDKIIRYKKKAD